MHKSTKITVLGLLLNTFLFIIKAIVGMLTGSLAIISDAFNSLTDIISSTGILVAVRISSKKADGSHPFGHHRFEPLAGLLVAVTFAILAYEILKNSISGLFVEKEVVFNYFMIIVLVITIVVKVFMAKYFIREGKKLNSPAIRASGADSFNDVLVSSVALIGIIALKLGFIYMDNIAAILISFFILYSGYKIAMENIDYLTGRSPSKEEITKIKSTAMKVKGVKGLNDVKGHYVGNFIHIEIHIEVNSKLSTKASHDIGTKVRKALEGLSHVDKAFVHIDPM